jgi:hypothetical protein
MFGSREEALLNMQAQQHTLVLRIYLDHKVLSPFRKPGLTDSAIQSTTVLSAVEARPNGILQPINSPPIPSSGYTAGVSHGSARMVSRPESGKHTASQEREADRFRVRS